MARKRTQTNRRGAIVPLTAVMLIAFIGMVAFAVDSNWMVMTKAELQNSADAAALAGAQKLVDNYPIYSAPGQSATNKATLAAAAVTAARSTARTYGAANGAGGLATLTYLDGDIEVGFTNASGDFTAYSSGGNYPNTVKVKARRDSSANNPLSLFFGSLLGTSKVSMVTPATATLYTGTVNSFQFPSAGNTAILPFTYDVNAWKNYVNTGKDPDGNTTYDNNQSRNPVIQVYPCNNYTGNFGQLSLNNSNVGDSVMRTWVQNGCSSADLGADIAAGLLPISSHDATKWDWQGSSGFESALIQTVNNNIGQVSWLPLFKPYNANQATYAPGVGSGANYYYNIVAFVPVKIVQPTNGNRQVVLQSVDLVDSAAVFSGASIAPAGTSTSTYFSTVLAPRLSN